MYGYSQQTIAYWAVETIGIGLIAIVLALGIWKKWRWTAFVYPVGQFLIRLSILFLKPSEYGYEVTLEKAGLLVGLMLFSVLMFRYAGFGYVVTVGCVWMLSITLPAGVADLGVFFTFGGELTYLGLQVIFSALQYILLGLLGFWFGAKRIRPFLTD